VHLGPYPVERLARAEAPAALAPSGLPRLDPEGFDGRRLGGATAVAGAMAQSFDLFAKTRSGLVAPAGAPGPDDLGRARTT
jgi:hypothetical protein